MSFFSDIALPLFAKNVEDKSQNDKFFADDMSCADDASCSEYQLEHIVGNDNYQSQDCDWDNNSKRSSIDCLDISIAQSESTTQSIIPSENPIKLPNKLDMTQMNIKDIFPVPVSRSQMTKTYSFLLPGSLSKDVADSNHNIIEKSDSKEHINELDCLEDTYENYSKRKDRPTVESRDSNVNATNYETLSKSLAVDTKQDSFNILSLPGTDSLTDKNIEYESAPMFNRLRSLKNASPQTTPTEFVGFHAHVQQVTEKLQDLNKLCYQADEKLLNFNRDMSIALDRLLLNDTFRRNAFDDNCSIFDTIFKIKAKVDDLEKAAELNDSFRKSTV